MCFGANFLGQKLAGANFYAFCNYAHNKYIICAHNKYIFCTCKIGGKAEEIRRDREVLQTDCGAFDFAVGEYISDCGGNVATKFYLKNLLVLRSETCQIT